jgi:hypothetical protein
MLQRIQCYEGFAHAARKHALIFSGLAWNGMLSCAVFLLLLLTSVLQQHAHWHTCVLLLIASVLRTHPLQELGVTILQDLARQRETITHARDTLHGADDNISKARKVRL